DGGTRFAKLNLKDHPADEYWIFTDGLVNLRQETLSSNHLEENPDFSLPTTPVYVLNASPSSDARALALLAQNGGQVIDLYAQPLPRAIQVMTQRPYQLIDVAFPANSVGALRSSAYQSVEGPFMLVGKLLADESTLKLGLGSGQEVAEYIDISLDKLDDYAASGMVADAWARAEIQHLYHQPSPDQDAMLSLGQMFHRLTPNASLLVLDRIEDYVRYRVLPPNEALKAEYKSLVAQEEERKKIEWVSHIDKVASAFLSRKVWWETEFAPLDTPYEKEDQKKEAEATPEPQSATEEMADSDPSASLSDLSSADQAENKAEETSGGKITLNTWESDAPYMDTLRKVAPQARYALYLDLKARYGQLPVFYIDVADLFWRMRQGELAVKILSNLGEIGLDNPQFLRTMGRRLFSWK
ncbi:MAG: hypothetical protein AAFR59_16470, partial [Bacteroidota bacterium]